MFRLRVHQGLLYYVLCNIAERMQVVTVPKTEPPFLVLENMVGSHQKGVHVISMSSKKDLKLVNPNIP